MKSSFEYNGEKIDIKFKIKKHKPQGSFGYIEISYRRPHQFLYRVHTVDNGETYNRLLREFGSQSDAEITDLVKRTLVDYLDLDIIAQRFS